MKERKYSSKENLIRKLCVVFLLLPVAVLLAWGFLVPAQYSETYLGELKQKEERLALTEGKRIVIIGGSAAAFGIDTGMLEEEFPEYTTVNFGLYAALGTKAMMDLAEKDLREGDLVILMPEQQEQTLSLYFNGDYLWEALDGNFSALLRIKSENIGEVIGTFPAFAADKFRSFVTGDKPTGSGVYRRSSFDDYGDMKPELVTGNVMAEEYDPTVMADFSEEYPDEDMISYINDFTERMGQKGVRVLYHLCPVNEKGLEEEEDPAGYYEWLREELDCTLLGDPLQSIMDSEFFYDTNFHLNGTGKIYFTRQFVKDLKSDLGIAEKTASAEYYLEKQRLAMKDAAEDAENGDGAETGRSTGITGNSQTGGMGALEDTGNSEEIETDYAEYYLYTENAYGCIITGLTEKGKTQSKLEVPGMLNGQPVIRIAEGTFSGNTKLQQVTLAAGVAVVEDGAFRGCSSLRKIILLSEEPENCQVGQNLLEGCDAGILVPEGGLSAYKRSYWWSAYADRMKENDPTEEQ